MTARILAKAATSDGEDRPNIDPRKLPSGEELTRVLANIKRVSNQRRQASQMVRETYSEACAIGFDRKTLQLIVKLSEMEPDEREDFLARLDALATYLKYW